MQLQFYPFFDSFVFFKLLILYYYLSSFRVKGHFSNNFGASDLLVKELSVVEISSSFGK